MFSLRTDIMMIEFFSSLRRRMTELDSMDCPECSGPPPIFRLPPPPRPPFLTESAFCSEAPLAELEDCIAIPMIDASYQANPSLQNTALIITCTIILLLMAAVVSVVFWKHKRKVQNILPCKSAAAAAAAAGGRGMVLPNGQSLPVGPGNVTNAARLYEDLLGNSHRSDIHNNLPVQLGIQPTIEMLDVNKKIMNGRGEFVCSSPGPEPYESHQDLYNPVYEELCNGDHHPDTDEEKELKIRNVHQSSATSKSASEDEFAEDELSIGEPSESRNLTAPSGPLSWRTCPTVMSAGVPRERERERKGRRSPRSLDRRKKNKAHDIGEFHEGMLLDALLHLHPNIAGVGGARTNSTQRYKSPGQKMPYFVPTMETTDRNDENPYESVPVLGPLHHYTNQNKTNKKESSSTTTTSSRKLLTQNNYYDKYHPGHYGSEYFGLHNHHHHHHQNVTTPIYTQVGGDYSDTYSQPNDKLYYNDDKYSQPVYYTSRDQDEISSNKLYQGQPDSSFGSDSGYSHHTSGGGGGGGICNSGTRNSITRSNYRKDKHRNSNHSNHSVDFILT